MMNALLFYQRNLSIFGKLGLQIACLAALSASAQTPSPSVEQQTPAAASLNLDPDAVVQEMTKDPQPVDKKTEAISTTHDVFEQSLLDSVSRKKISGFVQGGAGTGRFQEHGQKSENFTCENTAAGLNDQLSNSTSVSVYAQMDSCKTR